ncbi:hypothetical protein ACFWXO_31970 [Kitasatospora sp. NPDC059088]|uniref:hypothetical protein n=1 Tax=Kitasatospora sp. NPDC059088 TaxID=3346722 RepID=UPI00367DA3BE
MSEHQQLVLIEITGQDGTTTLFVTAERREKAWIDGPIVGLYTRLRLTDAPQAKPEAMFLSRRAAKAGWTVDSHFGASGHPFHSHGFGARHSVPEILTQKIAALVDAEAPRAGLVEAIDQTNPLILPDQD